MLWSPNCQLLYPFEDQANDYSGNARHGTVFGSGVYATKPNGGRCLYFDGTGDYVATPSFGLSGTVVVFACWIRAALSTLGDQMLIADNAQSPTVGFLLAKGSADYNDLSWNYANGLAPAWASSPNYFVNWHDVWLHLTVACDYAGKKTYFYRNGLWLNTVTMSGTPVFPSTNRAKYLGCYNPALYFLKYGYLANVFLGTLATMPPAGQMLANVKRLMLGMNPIW